MIDRVLEFSLRQRAFVLLLAAGLLGVGLWSGYHLPVDAVPDITGVQVQVNTEVRALAAEESERLVTQVIERELAGLPGVEEMRSLTKFGLSQVTLSFEDGTDVYRARQLVSERLQGVVEGLPAGATPRLAPISTGLGEILYYSVQYREGATNRPVAEFDRLVQLSEVQKYLIKPLLRTVPGLADVNESGGYERQYLVQARPEALELVGMTFGELADLIAQNVENTGGGVIDRGGRQLTIRAVGRVRDVEDIENLPLKFGVGVEPLLVRDVAEVRMGAKFRSGAATLNGEETVLGTAMMLAGQNSRVVAERVKARLAEIRGKLPEGIEVEIQYDRSGLIDRTIGTVKSNLFEGAVLVVAVLLFMLGNWRAALIVATAIPLSFLFALTGMARFGISGNLMSLGAIDFGLIIDGAVVIVENIVRQLGERQHKLGRTLSEEERVKTVLAACKQVGAPMFFGVVIITVVYIPVLALTGIEGKMFHPMALTVMLALVGALMLALTLMPVLASVILRGSIREGDNWVVSRVKRLYRPSLVLALRLRGLVVMGAVALFVASLWLFTHLGAEFVPKLDEGSITAMFYKEVGMSLEESLRRDKEVSLMLLEEFPEVTRVFTRIGTSDIATDPMPPNESDVYIFYRPVGEWPGGEGRLRTKAELQVKIEEALRAVDESYSMLFAQPIEMRFNEMLEGTKAELAVKVFGNDYDVLERLAEQIKGILEETPGVAQVEFETEGRTSQLQIDVRRDVLRRYGLQVQEVNEAVEAALAGRYAGTVVEGNRRYEIAVRMPEELRGDDEAISRLPVRVGEHGLVTLGQLVDFTVLQAVDPIQHDDGQRRAALMVNLATRDIEGFVRAAEGRIEAEVEMPENYFVQFGGQFENLQEARTRLAVVVPSALVLIFVLIFLAFGSLRQAMLVYSGIPLAVTGGVLALWLRGMPFSITAAVGFIALSGVAVLNGLVMISYFNQLREEGLDVRESVIEGSVTRLRPVLMTALVAALGFVPMALATGAGAEVQRPLATVVIGGILSSTFLTLVVLPVLYAWFERNKAQSAER
ncbi:MAG: Cobalt-zinc-cadmium resistance protein CzcA [Verrucomicrobiota bacterium]